MTNHSCPKVRRLLQLLRTQLPVISPNENDERLERSILIESVASAARICQSHERVGVGEPAFEEILATVAKHIEDALSASPMALPQTPSVETGVWTNDHALGRISSGALNLLNEKKLITGPTVIEFSQTESLLIWARPEEISFAFVIRASRQHLSLIRSRVWESLYLMLRLVHTLVQVEANRISWTLRTIHEIRQPVQGLAAIADQIQFLANTETAPRREIAYWADDMETGIFRLKVLLSLFDYLAGIGTSEPHPVRTLIEKDVLRPIHRYFARLAKSRKLTLSDTIGYDIIPTVMLDPDFLSLIFYNLVLNAIKYSKPNTRILISCGKSHDDYWIEIENHGSEIYADEELLIFTDGYRGRSAKQIESGLGFGLPVSQALASLLGCRIQLVSRGGDGNKVSFRLYIPKGLQA